MSRKVVLAYSGGLDTSSCIPLLTEKYDFDEVLTVSVDVGQPEVDISRGEEKARALGVKHWTIDAVGEFVSDYLFPAIKANATYEGYVLGTALARPLIAKKVVDVAEEEGAIALAHGCTGKGNDQIRFENIFRKTRLRVVAPIREHNMTRVELIQYTEEHGIPVSTTIEKPWSIDENLWNRSIEGGELEDPEFEPPDEIFEWTALEEGIGNERLTISFENGTPVGIDGIEKDGIELIKELNIRVGKHGIGRTDIVEDRVLGLKSREIYEHPAATILLSAHSILESLILTRNELRFKSTVDAAWSELAYQGLVEDPLFSDLSAFIDKSQERVSGEVTYELGEGTLKLISRSSPNSIFSKELVSFDDMEQLDQKDAAGFIKYFGLQTRM